MVQNGTRLIRDGFPALENHTDWYVLGFLVAVMATTRVPQIPSGCQGQDLSTRGSYWQGQDRSTRGSYWLSGAGLEYRSI